MLELKDKLCEIYVLEFSYLLFVEPTGLPQFGHNLDSFVILDYPNETSILTVVLAIDILFV